MEINVNPVVPAELVALARVIACARKYPVLIRGLQPLEDYEISGKIQPGLKSKYNHELVELHECLTEGLERNRLLRRAANCLYYAACIVESSDDLRPYYAYVATIAALAKPYNISQQEAEAAALAKYRYRASRPWRKPVETREEHDEREARENAAIMAAIDSLALPFAGHTVQDLASALNISEHTLYTAMRNGSIRSRQSNKTRIINTSDSKWIDWLAQWRLKK